MYVPERGILPNDQVVASIEDLVFSSALTREQATRLLDEWPLTNDWAAGYRGVREHTAAFIDALRRETGTGENEPEEKSG